ncbi:YggT family protein [Actinomyces sp. Marseille-P3109]|uniref:YggT family protein n=1 Tax=Actinomyces sp. Marseille-P3109 TaxID=2083009 RepID=UPI000D553022|nr:YggT family protein [Actinomyces sp. Marseille-P3109]
MTLVSSLAWILSSILSLYFLILLVRVVLDWVQVFARQWRPRGLVLVLANLVYALTDPPLRLIRRRVPMARLGGVGIDLSFLVLVFGIWILQWFLRFLH